MIIGSQPPPLQSQGSTGEVSLTNYDRQEGREVLGDGPLSTLGIPVVGFSGFGGTEHLASAEVRKSLGKNLRIPRVHQY